MSEYDFQSQLLLFSRSLRRGVRQQSLLLEEEKAGESSKGRRKFRVDIGIKICLAQCLRGHIYSICKRNFSKRSGFGFSVTQHQR